MTMMLSSSSTTIPTTFLGLLAANVGLPLFVGAAEITIDDFYSKINPTAALPGFNVEGGSVFTNVAMAVKNKQLFFNMTGTFVFETPEADLVRASHIFWCSDLTFSDFNSSSLIGYAGRCVARMSLLGKYADNLASGATLAFPLQQTGFMFTAGISAVFVEQLNVFEGQYHVDTDDNTWRFWDDGRKTMPTIAWEGHDEGDMNPNAATSSFSVFGGIDWMSADDVAQFFNTSVDQFTPEKFKQVYKDMWFKVHEAEAATKNPNTEAELEIIEQVKNETISADETATTPPVQPDDNGDNATPVVEEDSGSGRQLVSVAARFVSAALRVFGI